MGDERVEFTGGRDPGKERLIGYESYLVEQIGKKFGRNRRRKDALIQEVSELETLEQLNAFAERVGIEKYY